jgi:cobalamin synthase
MNWKLIFQLSLFGLAMAFATVYWIPSNLEPLFWIVIFIICAFLIATRCSDKFFGHGLLVGLVNCIWITTVHVLLAKTYLANHPKEADMMTQMPWPKHPRYMMAVTGPIIGVISGIILGFFAFIASKIVKRPAVHS